jgi:hypothetical protein
MNHFLRPIFASLFAACMIASIVFRRMLLQLRAREALTLTACGVW